MYNVNTIHHIFIESYKPYNQLLISSLTMVAVTSNPPRIRSLISVLEAVSCILKAFNSLTFGMFNLHTPQVMLMYAKYVLDTLVHYP